MTSVTDNAQRSRLELHVDDALAGWLDYRPAGDSIILAHTEVAPGHEGQGLGGVLVRGALDHARAAGKTVIATCPFAASYIDRHPELDEYLAPHARRRT
jgi:predicted GNAT family acetyltransferase